MKDKEVQQYSILKPIKADNLLLILDGIYLRSSGVLRNLDFKWQEHVVP